MAKRITDIEAIESGDDMRMSAVAALSNDKENEMFDLFFIVVSFSRACGVL
jgi:hypothetical protein